MYVGRTAEGALKYCNRSSRHNRNFFHGWFPRMALIEGKIAVDHVGKHIRRNPSKSDHTVMTSDHCRFISVEG
jgi:hypothetical protein